MALAPKTFILPFAVLLLAASLRFYDLGSTPPGLFHDEAMNGVDALDVIYNGYHPLYFERNQGGREPLFIYLTTASVFLFGATPFAMRLVPAFIGLLTVAATYSFANKLFGRRAALTAAALLTLSHWHLHFSRTSFRAISFPLLEIAVFLLLWKGMSSGRNRYFALSGFAAGLAMYTYFSSRLLPILIAIFFAYMAALHRKKTPWPGLALFCAAGIIVSAPLGYYYWDHPSMFFARVNQVSAISLAPQADSVASLWESTVNTLGMFSYRGDINWKYNLPGKPIFDQLGLVLLLGGLGLAALRAKRSPGYALVLIWMVVMLLPGILSTESPSFLRALGIVPVVFILPALALDALWSRLSKVGMPSRAGWLLPLAAVVWLGYIGVSTVRDYFGEWANSRETYYAFNSEMVEIGRYLNTVPSGEPVYLSSKYFNHPSVLFSLRRPVDLKWFNGSQSLVFPELEGDVTYVFPYSALPADLDEVFPAKDRVTTKPGPGGSIAFVAYRSKPAELRENAAGAASEKTTGRVFGDTIELVGYRAGKETKAGETLPFDILWRVLQTPEQTSDLAFFSHLVDQRGQMWGLGDANEYPSSQWSPGDLILGRYDLRVKPDALPGRYYVDVGIYDRWTGDRLLLPGKEKLDHLLIALAKISQTDPSAVPVVQRPLAAAFAGGVKLLGFDLKDGTGGAISAEQGIRSGSKLGVTFYWQAASRQSEDYTVFLQLLDASGKVVAQDDSQPAGNRFPTTFWDPGESIVDKHLLTIDPALPPGEYALVAGMYLLETGKRLNVMAGDQPAADHVILGNVKLEAK